MNDYVVLVDDSNNPLGTMDKYEAHTGETPLHRGFSVFLFTRNGDLLLQKRSAKKKTWPNIWSNSCCGHPMTEESVVDAGKRRLKYELGLTDIDLFTILPDYRYRFIHKGIVENEFCPVMVGFTDNSPLPNPDEVSDIKYIKWEKFLVEIRKKNDYSEWCVEEALLLSQHPLFQSIYSQNLS